METTKVFRFLVLGSLALVIFTAVAAFYEPALPEAVTAYLDGEGAGPLYRNLDTGPLSTQIALGALLVGLLAAHVASCIGMLMFRSWARVTFIGTIVVGLALIPPGGSMLLGPLQSALDALFNMVDGAILVMLLVDPIKAKFAAQRPIVRH